MSKRDPLFAESHREIEISESDKEDPNKSNFLKYVEKWLLMWCILGIIIVSILSENHSYQVSMYYTGYVIIFISGIVGYGAFMKGNYSTAYGMFFGQPHHFKNEGKDSRDKMFEQWTGCILGILLGIFLILGFN